jgi:hypothetical protein
MCSGRINVVVLQSDESSISLRMLLQHNYEDITVPLAAIRVNKAQVRNNAAAVLLISEDDLSLEIECLTWREDMLSNIEKSASELLSKMLILNNVCIKL